MDIAELKFVYHGPQADAVMEEGDIQPVGGIDMFGWSGVFFLVHGTTEAGASLTARVQESALSDSGMEDIAGSLVVITALKMNKLAVIQHIPKLRYVQCIRGVVGTGGATSGPVMAILYGPRGVNLLQGGAVPVTVAGAAYTAANIGNDVVAAKAIHVAVKGTA